VLNETRALADWRGGVWTPAQMDPREWLPRAMTPKNKWGKIVAFDSIHLMVCPPPYLEGDMQNCCAA